MWARGDQKKDLGQSVPTLAAWDSHDIEHQLVDFLVGGIARVGGGIGCDGCDRRERTCLDRALSRSDCRHGGHGRYAPASSLRSNRVEGDGNVFK